MKYSEVEVIKSTHLSTGEKRYIPHVYGKALILSWNTATRAEVYGNRVFERCKRLAIARVIKNKKEN